MRSLDSVKAILAKCLRGQEDIIELSLAAFLAEGHLLLEGPPGTGKTTLAKGIAGAFGGSFRRIQMTSDLLPSDVVGILRLRAGAGDFEFRPGPVFSNFLLADELNRTSPKTQSALLEAMAEGTVTVDGVSHALPEPFFVVGTQNPREFHGVYPFAESQLDRFMLHLSLDHPGKDDELGVYKSARDGAVLVPGSEGGDASFSIEQTREMRATVAKVFVDDTVLAYVAALVQATRAHPEVAYGVSVRGGLQLVSCAKALAWIRGRDFVSPKEIRDLAVPAMAHRLCFAGTDPDTRHRVEIIRKIVESVPAPR